MEAAEVPLKLRDDAARTVNSNDFFFPFICVNMLTWSIIHLELVCGTQNADAGFRTLGYPQGYTLTDVNQYFLHSHTTDVPRNDGYCLANDSEMGSAWARQ